MAFGDTTRGRLVLFGGLYFAQGVPWGLVTIALALRLSSLGLGAAAIGGLAAMAQMPFIGKPLLAPLVDRAVAAGGRLRTLLLGAQLGMAVSLIALALADPVASLARFDALVFVNSLFAAAQDVVTDALALAALPADQRGRANGVMSAAKWGGSFVGGSGIALLSARIGWTGGYLTALALLSWPVAMVLALREPPATPRAPSVLRETLRSFAERGAAVGAALALVLGASDAFVYPVAFSVLRGRLGLGDDQVTFLVSLGLGAGAVGALLGGALADRLGRRWAVALAGALVVLGHLGFARAAPLWGNGAVRLAYFGLGGVASGALYAATLALFMDLTNPRVAATHFQIYMALLNVRGWWASIAGGRLAEIVPATALYVTAAGIELFALMVLLPLAAPRARAPASRSG